MFLCKVNIIELLSTFYKKDNLKIYPTYCQVMPNVIQWLSKTLVILVLYDFRGLVQKHITLQIAISLYGLIWDAIMKGSLENVLPFEGSLAP